MSSYLDLYTAQYFAAHTAYGDLPSGRPAFTDAFGKLLVDGWVAMAAQANVPGGDAVPGLLQVQIWSRQAAGVDWLTGSIQGWLGQDNSLSSNADDIWQAVGTLAGYLSYYQLPGPIDEALASLASAAKIGGAYLEARMLDIAKAAGAGAISVIAIVVALGIGYVILMRHVP